MVLNPEIFSRGKKTRWRVIGKDTMNQIWNELTATTQPIQEYVTEIAWGEIFSRPGLDEKTRILLNLAMLTVQGENRVLALHIRAAVNLGCSHEEIRETLIQTMTFAGVVRAAQASRTAQDVFDALDESNRPELDSQQGS